MFNGVPYSYEESNIASAMCNPSAVTVQNTQLTAFFRRYLLQKAMSRAEWTLPEGWSKRYFLYALHVIGNVAIIKTDRFGVIPQHCTLQGKNVQYQPLRAKISNPLLKGVLDPVIDKQCVLFSMTCDYGGVLDLVNHYAGLMALVSEAFAANTFNSKLAYILAAEGDAMAKTMQAAMDGVLSGKPYVVAGKKMFDANGRLRMDLLLNNLSQNFIAPEQMELLRAIENRFDEEMGFPQTYTQKKERMLTGELEGAAEVSGSRFALWMEGWQESCRKTKNMFGVDVSVKLRGAGEEEKADVDDKNLPGSV